MAIFSLHFPFGTLEPGERKPLVGSIPPDAKPFRPSRIVANVKPLPVEWRFFTKGVGGSKRRGRRASLLFHAEKLRTNLRGGDVTLDDIHIGELAQMMGSAPLDIFGPGEMFGELMLDTCRPRCSVRIVITNRERARRCSVTIAMIGRA